ncbi:uncharacterized protein LOC123312439 isoform X3 [Coccinella septempunctata]|uniref:uncharacterized protein LOC123312439 isoform X3 n=1 Tax=Coccinella septempunctata TaxID=41139 RepID=UPI001D090723|nr:uncharacterized protein LOC123312439 isoform X3 [Coccinella septempunctata]
MQFWDTLRSKVIKTPDKSVRIKDENAARATNPHISPENVKQIEIDQRSTIDEEAAEWVNESEHPEKKIYSVDSEDPRNVKILYTTKKLHWTNVLSNIILIADIHLWRLTLLCFIYTDYVVKMYQICFIKRHHLDAVFYIEVITDLLFFLNYVCLLTMFFWKRLQLLVRQKRSIYKLVFDGFLLLPYHIFYYIATREEKVSSAYAGLAAISFLRLYYFEEYFNEKGKEAGLKHWNYFVAKYILHLFWFTHTIACILYLLACPFECEQPTGWGYVIKTKEPTIVWYIYASYMAFMNLSNSGFSEFIATNHKERIVISITMYCGFAITTLILIGALSSDMVIKLFRLANIRIQLNAIKKHLKMIGMDEYESNQIMSYYRLFWNKKKGVKEASAINLLPLPLKMEISFDINYYLLQCSMLFRDKPEPFLRTLSLNMKHEFFQPGEIIFKCNVIKYKMICVASGIVEVLSDEDYESPIISFGKGTVLGEAALILTLPAKTTVRAANYCELQVLYKVDFVQIIKLFPDIYLQLREAILTRIDYFRHDEYMIEFESKFTTLNLYVSQKMNLSAIKRVKKRLLGEHFEDMIPESHQACDLYKYAENVKKKKGRYIALTSRFPWILSPNSSFLRVWEFMILLDVLTIAFLYPYFISYHRGFPYAIANAAIILELCYPVDIYIILTTAIEGKDFIIKTFTQLLHYHLRSFRFHLEILSTLPIEYFFFRSSNHVFYTMKLNRLIKCYRIYTFFKKTETQFLVSNILALRLIKYAIFIILVNYWYGILLYSSTCFSPLCLSDGWYRQHLIKDQKLKLSSPCTSYPTLMSTYFGLTVLSTLGYDDIIPGNIQDMILMIVGVICGIFLFGFCTSELSATITYNIQMKINFQSQMFAVEKFLIDNKMRLSIRSRVMKFFELQWYYNKGVYFWKNSLLYNATTKIQRQVTFKERLEIISNLEFFKEADEEFVELIATDSRTIILPPGEIITYAGGSSRDMYIIQRGFCNKETEPGSNETLGPGTQFGTRNILLGWPNLYKITTITHVKLIAISDSLYNSAISLFPKQNALIQKAVPPESLGFLDECKANWARWDYKTSPMSESKIRKERLNFKEWFEKAVAESFIYVPDYCYTHEEDYEQPFEELGFFYRIKYVLLPVCILPQGWFLKIWIGIRITTSILYALLIPFQLIQAPYIPELDPLMLILDIIAYIDLYLMLLVGFYGDVNQLVIHPCKTSAHYLKGSFIIDVIICFPWELIIKFLVPEHNEGHSDFGHKMSPHWMHCSVRLVKIFQAYRLPSVFNHLEMNIRTKGLYLQVLKFVPFTIIFLNVCAAIIMITSCKYYHITELDPKFIVGSIATPPGMGSKQIREYTMFCKRDCWIERSTFQQYHTPQSIYMLAIYWTTSTLVGAGFGDLTAQDIDHLIIISIMTMCGVFFFGYVFAYISSYTSDLQSVFSIYQGMVTEMKRYFQIESTSKMVREISLANASYRWNRSEGMEPNKILSILHPALHEDCVLQLYENTLKEIPLFEGVDRTFFRIVGKSLRERYYIRGSYIFREDDVIDTIYIVHRGKLEIKFYHNFYEEMVTSIGVGGMLGNIGNHLKSRMLSTAIALTNMDTLYMKTEDFYRILNKYPEVKNKIALSFAREEHKDFCIPITMIDEESDSLPEVASETSVDPDDESLKPVPSFETSLSGSIKYRRKTKASKDLRLEGGLKVVRTELMTLLFVFTPKRWFNMVILPESKVLYALVLICVICGYVNAILVTYQFAFQDFNFWCILIMVLFDVVHLWNTFMELHTAYLNRFSDYVTDNKRIKRKYFSRRKKRIVDFIANTPFPYAVFLLPVIFGVEPYTAFSFLKLFTLLRIWDVKEFFNSRWTNLMVDRLVLKLFSVFIWITLMIHVFSCVWYMFACPIFICYTNSWVRIFYERPRSQFEIYVICVYFILGVSTNTGIGDILPGRYIEIIFLIILMLTAKFMIGIFIGIAANIVSLHSSFLTRYEERIYELRDYLLNENVSDHQMEKMWNYVKQLWTKRNGRQMPRIITDTMAYTNQCALKYDVYGEELRNSYLFHDLQEPFLRQLSNNIMPVMFFPGNYIVQHGDSDQSMYFVHRGQRKGKRNGPV